ncbi:tRNA adenosine(34) deaminase TadA [Brevibacterium daeguense]|uniref:tRNA-specific adenosine deaminase n=2 Tax=Brevibacterium daeguense TaxID=909936 RepID=A0ABP8EKU2_9MICO
MRAALAQAARAGSAEDVPVGAVVVSGSGEVLGAGFNRREVDSDPTAHAEVVALREAGRRLGSWRLERASLIVTLEPCVMCAGAAVAARVERIVFGAFDEKAGACGSVWDLPRDRASLHRPEVYAGVLAAECTRMLSDFFGRRR